MEHKWDVAIVGAGPAGAIAAHRLASAGIKVALLERYSFPRNKSCGDGVTYDGLVALQKTGLQAWANQYPAFESLRFSSPDGQILDVPLDDEGENLVGRTIPRRVMDEQVAAAAQSAGATLLEESRVSEVIPEMDGVRIRYNNQSLLVNLVILAEGSHAPLTRSLGLVQDGPELMAARQYLCGDIGSDRSLEIHFQSSIIPGYNWMFPVGNGRINIGTGTYTSRTQNREISLRAELERFKSDPIFKGRLERTEPDGPIEGHPLRTQFGLTNTHTDRIMVVGDAAGLVNPFTGVGIGPAMRSGELAAETALNALTAGIFSSERLSEYSQKLKETFAADRLAAMRLRSLLSKPKRLNKLFATMKRDADLALLFGHIIFDKRSPRTALKLSTILKTIF